MIQCPPRLPIPYIKIETDLSGFAFNAYSLALNFIIQTNRFNPDLNQNDFSQGWTRLAGSQVIFHTIKSPNDPIELQELFQMPMEKSFFRFRHDS